jgi:hypothetical protein
VAARAGREYVLLADDGTKGDLDKEGDGEEDPPLDFEDDGAPLDFEGDGDEEPPLPLLLPPPPPPLPPPFNNLADCGEATSAWLSTKLRIWVDSSLLCAKDIAMSICENRTSNQTIHRHFIPFRLSFLIF